MGGGADDPSYDSFGSRWGIKGSSEVSEGLTSVYKFETRVGQGDASQNTNQLYVGLSGGFGSITLGKQSGAAYNHSGAIRDISNWHSHGDVGSRISNALSYSYAAESFSMQVAAIMDSETDTDGAIDRAEFGMTVGLGDIGKVAIGYEKQEDSMMAGMPVKMASNSKAGAGDIRDNTNKRFALNADGTVKDFAKIEWRTKEANGSGRQIVEGTVSDVVYTTSTTATDTSILMPVMVYHKAGAANAPMDGSKVVKVGDKFYDDGSANDCIGTANAVSKDCTASTAAWVKVMSPKEVTGTKAGANPKPTYAVEDSSTAITATATVTPMEMTYGHKASHISASFGLAGITVGLGHTTKDSNDPMMGTKEKTNFLGASGSIGDSGLSWNAWGRNVDGHDGMETSPWTVGLAKSLGGGATTFIEHTNADDGEDGTTSIALRVDF